MSRTAFMGTPAFALPSLEALAAGSELVAVIAQPDRPRGRGQGVEAPPTADWALARGVRLLQPPRARAPDFLAEIAALKLDLIVVAAYGKILSAELLGLPRLGCVNVHASLLPKYRGAAPIQWAIARGEHETGVTLMQLDEGLDTGPMLAAARLPILPGDTGGSLTERVAALGGELLTLQLPALLAGALAPHPQDPVLATLAPKLTREDALLDFTRPALDLHDRVRAFQPWPGAVLSLGDGVLKILRTEVTSHSGPAGTLVEADKAGLVVATGAGGLRILELQPEGKRRMAAGDFLAGHRLQIGSRVSPARPPP